MAIERTSCLICNKTKFTNVNSFPSFPIMAISNDRATDMFYEYTLMACENCKCLQLKYLVDPSILYSDLYTNATFSPSWKDHHDNFSKFIIQNTTETQFLEVGANKGDLYKCLLKQKEIAYTSLDFFKHGDLPNEIKFIEGNCETFNFTGYKTIILSHVFEHLYFPRIFLENIQFSGVSTIFISIPNFNALLDEKSLCLLHSQHIFFCGDKYIKYLFSLYGYKCEFSYIYNGNFKSIMYKFTVDPLTEILSVPSTDIQLYKEIYVNKIDTITNIKVPPNTYIMPSGIYGQYFYYFLNNKENVLGFLDNNKERHSQKLYGTDKKVYSPLSIDHSNSTVIVCDCPYTKEIIVGLSNISKLINIIYI